MKRKTWLRKKLGRKRSILKAINKKKLGRFHRKCKQRRLWKIGAWNVRRWGAPNVPYDPWSKTRCIFRLATKRGWRALMLAHVSLQDMNSTNFTVDDTKWTVLVSGKVAIATEDTLAQSWQRGDSSALIPRMAEVYWPSSHVGSCPRHCYHCSICTTLRSLKANMKGFLRPVSPAKMSGTRWGHCGFGGGL